MTVKELIDVLETIKNKNAEITVENIDYPDSPFEIKYILEYPSHTEIILDNR